MTARFDHLVIAVPDLDEAAARWSAAGLIAAPGGRHPAGTANALVRGPCPAYVELIAADDPGSNPWLDRVRDHPGPLSWAVAVDDVAITRATLVEAGFEPGPVTDGSRTTPEGEVLRWRVCDLGDGPYDDDLPFLIEWATPMPPGPSDGPILKRLSVTPSDPERLAALLTAIGLDPDPTWPRTFHDAGTDAGVILAVLPSGEPIRRRNTFSVSFGSTRPQSSTTAFFSVPAGEVRDLLLDGVSVGTGPDRRGHPAAVLLPAVDELFATTRRDLPDWPDPHPHGVGPREEEYSRCDEPGRYRLLGARADAWVAAIVRARLGVESGEATWETPPRQAHARSVRLVGSRIGTLPIVVGWRALQGAADAIVSVGAGDPAVLLQAQPDCGCDACDTGSRDLLETIDEAFLLALGGGVLSVRQGERVVTRTWQGWSADGAFGRDEADRWLAEAEAGRRARGVLAGAPWIS